MSDRQLAAAGIRKGLELWPDANHWCQGSLTNNAEDGTLQRCTYQMLADGIGVPAASAWFPETAPFNIAREEIHRVAKARGVAGTEGSICYINNNNDFATMKSLVEEAATNLEKLDEQPQS